MFGRKRKRSVLDYREAPAFVDPVARMAYSSHALPLTSYRGGTGLLVQDTLNALNPAGYVQRGAQVIVSPWGRGTQPNDLPVQQSLTLQRDHYGSF